MVRVYFETTNRDLSELVAIFKNEYMYESCLHILKAEAKSLNLAITEAKSLNLVITEDVTEDVIE